MANIVYSLLYFLRTMQYSYNFAIVKRDDMSRFFWRHSKNEKKKIKIGITIRLKVVYREGSYR